MESDEADIFANRLKNYIAKKTHTVYHDYKKGQSKLHYATIQNKSFCNVQEVITSISKQVKAIQSADNFTKKEKKQHNINNYKTNDFLPVNIFHTVQPTEINNFETQCELDTQLINLIDGAETCINIPKNINQIFHDTNSDEGKDSRTEKPVVSDTVNNKIEENSQAQDAVCMDRTLVIITQNEDTLSKHNKENKELNNKIKRVNLEPIRVIETEIETINEIKSPIINKNTTEIKPLVFQLESFEKFENLAVPLINDSLDFETAKKLIHSQIRNKELFIQTHTEPVLSDRDKTPSPILGKSSAIKKKVIKNVNINTIEDEILFSDEDFEDLPLTCALATSFYEQNNVLDKTMFVGFQTASDKSIQVHTESYDKAKSILDDNVSITKLVEVIDNSKNRTEFNSVIGFTTAQGGKINVSKESLINTKRIFQDILDCENANSNQICHDVKKIKLSENKIPNTATKSTANMNNRIRETLIENRLSNEERCKFFSKNVEDDNIDECIMKEFDNNFIVDDSCLKAKNINVSETNKGYINKNIDNVISSGFKTAGNNTIKISAQGLVKSKNVFEDVDFADLKELIIENKENSGGFDNYSINQQSTMKFVGFKTANNNVIKISEQAYAKTKNIFDNIDQVSLSDEEKATDTSISSTKINIHLITSFNNEPVMLDKSDNNFKSPIAKSNFPKVLMPFSEVNKSFVGFKTANNKAVQISKAALAKSENIFKEILHDKEDEVKLSTACNKKIDGNKNNIVTKDVLNIQNIGFKTASNKDVQVTENALKKCKKLFQEINRNEVNDNIYTNNEGQFILPAFKTASNKLVRTSDKALAQARKLLSDNPDSKESTSFINDIFIDKFTVNGFKTANNKPVEISKEALIKSKEIFDYDNTTVLEPVKVDNTIFNGFKTASNKHVNISDAAIAKTKTLFQDLEKELSDYNEKKFVGFHTASNKEVKISEEALIESKKKMESVNLDENKLDKTRNEEMTKDVFIFQTANNKNVSVLEESLKKSRKINNNQTKLLKTTISKDQENLINMEDLINTEVIKDLEETLHTEEFNANTEFKGKTPFCKRSGSPILSCPKAKKRKFITPQVLKTNVEISNKNILVTKNSIKFCDNYKKNKIITLRGLKIDLDQKNIDSISCIYNFDSLLNFKFRGKRNDIDDDVWTTDKMKQYFTDAVNKKIIPNGWLDNHLKLIIWKLLSYEIFFSKSMEYACSANNVLNQLKYRYDRELYNVERPILRKILEKDEVSSKIMVLCVVCFYVDGVNVDTVPNKTQNIELLLTDGWYCVKACADRMFDQLICEGKVLVGTKLAIHGAELMNCEQGVAPWEDTSQVRLKISANSTRRVKWHTRLGYHGNAAIFSHLPVRVDGGKVSRIRVYVARVYPMLYIEKFDDGSTVTRSERLEHLHQIKYETDRQNQMEKLYEEVERMSEQESQDSETLDSDKNLDTGSQIYRAMKRSKDTTDFRINLTSTQTKLLLEHTNKKQDVIVEKLQKKVRELVKKRGLDLTRNVVPLLKIRVADVNNECVNKAMLTIWRPTDCLLELIKEGSWLDVYNVVPTAIRYGELQISAGRQSIFQKSKIKQNSFKIITDKLKRQCYPLKDLQTIDDDEIDAVGLVFMIEQTKNQFQNVFITDENKCIVCISFWGGISKFGFENILKIGEIISCINLQRRTGNTKDIPQYRVTEFSYFTKTSKIDVIRKYTDELITKFGKINKTKFINECVAIINNFNNSKNNNITPYRLNNSDYNISKNRIFIESPINNLELNLSGLDFESTFKETSPQDLSPNSKRKKAVNNKIARLKKYGEPPPLNSIHIQNSKIKPYKSPLINNTDMLGKLSKNMEHVISPNVASIKLLPENKMNSSPLLNRTFTKCINPIKLNFSKESDATDPFDEEFDYSPPLSLE